MALRRKSRSDALKGHLLSNFGMLALAALLAVSVSRINSALLTSPGYGARTGGPQPLKTGLPGLTPPTLPQKSRPELLANIVFMVNTRGIPCLIQVDECPDQSLVRQLRAKVAQWRFVPATRNGRPFLQVVTVPLLYPESP